MRRLKRFWLSGGRLLELDTYSSGAFIEKKFVNIKSFLKSMLNLKSTKSI